MEAEPTAATSEGPVSKETLHYVSKAFESGAAHVRRPASGAPKSIPGGVLFAYPKHHNRQAIIKFSIIFLFVIYAVCLQSARQ